MHRLLKRAIGSVSFAAEVIQTDAEKDARPPRKTATPAPVVAPAILLKGPLLLGITPIGWR